MPRASNPAADAATDTEPVLDAPEEVAAQPEATQPPDPNPWPHWRFVGDGPLTYAAIPVTVHRGDVIAHPEVPADDGRWEPTDADVTRLPDNHRAEPAQSIEEG